MGQGLCLLHFLGPTWLHVHLFSCIQKLQQQHQEGLSYCSEDQGSPFCAALDAAEERGTLNGPYLVTSTQLQ